MHIVLNSFGASIAQENGLFAVSTAEGKQLISAREVKSITVSRGARISSDAVLLAIQNEVDVIFVDSMGKPQGRVWSIRYGSISDIRRKQLDFLYSPAAVEWVKDLVVEKINGQVAMLLALQLDQPEATQRRILTVLNRLEDYKNKVRRCEGELVSDVAPSLRGWEGAASRHYIQMLSECLPEKYRFDERSRQPATDPFNAMLNYGYGMLYGKVEGALVKAGLDPYTGIFHRDDFNRPALVFDVIERYRTWIDYVVVQLCLQDAMVDECFITHEDGAVLLQGLGKRILIQSVNDYLAEVISWKGVERSRAEHIQLDAHRLATFFLNQSPSEKLGDV